VTIFAQSFPSSWCRPISRAAELPLTPNSQINRNALPPPAATPNPSFEADAFPRNRSAVWSGKTRFDLSGQCWASPGSTFTRPDFFLLPVGVTLSLTVQLHRHSRPLVPAGWRSRSCFAILRSKKLAAFCGAAESRGSRA